MKRILVISIVFMFWTATAFGQHFVGIKGGWGVGDVRFFPNYKTQMVGGMLNGGITWRYYNDNPKNLVDKYAGGIAAELEFIQRGFCYESLTEENIKYKRTINSVILPFMWQPHIYMSQGKIMAFLNAGITLHYNISSKEYKTDILTGVETENKYDMISVRDNRWGYGLCGGVGFGYNVGRLTISAEGRYYFGYSDILKRKTLYEDNIFMRSPLDNIMVGFGVSYRLGKQSGIEAESRSMKRAARKEAEQAVSDVSTDGDVSRR